MASTSPLQGRRLLSGVSGSIAAYKAASFVRLLVKAGAEVQVILTEAAAAFVTPLTLGTLSKKPVLTGFLRDAAAGDCARDVEVLAAALQGDGGRACRGEPLEPQEQTQPCLAGCRSLKGSGLGVGDGHPFGEGVPTTDPVRDDRRQHAERAGNLSA